MNSADDTTANTYSRPRGAEAFLLDNDALIRAARPVYAEMGGNPDHLTSIYTQMILAVERGLPAIVNSEGVGAMLSEDDTIGVYFAAQMSIVRIDIPFDALNNAVTDEVIDLADGIRSFGSRLEANFHRWHSIYDPAYRPAACR